MKTKKTISQLSTVAILCVLLIGCSGGIRIVDTESAADGAGGGGGGGSDGGGSGGTTVTLDAPANVAAVAGDHQITISWDAVDDADSYNIYWSTSTGVTTDDTQITGATSPYVHSNLATGITYYYVVEANASVEDASIVVNALLTKSTVESDLSSETSASIPLANDVQYSYQPADAEAPGGPWWAPTLGDYTGWSVSISGNLVIIGAPYENGGSGDPSADAGRASALVLGSSGWGVVTAPVPSDLAAGDNFGYATAVSGDVTLISSPASGAAEQGSVYFFQRNADGTWTQEKETGTYPDDETVFFGASVDINGTTAIVSALTGNPACTLECPAGPDSAYIFEQSGGSWSQSAVLTAAVPVANDTFGSSVAVRGNTAVVGASEDGDTDTGAAYVYQKTGAAWNQAYKLVASDGAANEAFGVSVEISEDGQYIFVGAVYTFAIPGAVYVFNASTGAIVTRITASDGAAGNTFGNSVSSNGNYLLVGTDNEAAYLYELGTWTEKMKYTAATPNAGDRFGLSVAIDDYIVIGAPAINTATIF